MSRGRSVNLAAVACAGAVFVHGGVFRLYNPIDANYAMLMSKLVALGSFGVLGVDYRTTDAQ